MRTLILILILACGFGSAALWQQLRVERLHEERVLAGVRLRYPYSPKTIKRERQRLSCAEPGPDELAAIEAWLAELDLAS